MIEPVISAIPSCAEIVIPLMSTWLEDRLDAEAGALGSGSSSRAMDHRRHHGAGGLGPRPVLPRDLVSHGGWHPGTELARSSLDGAYRACHERSYCWCG